MCVIGSCGLFLRGNGVRAWAHPNHRHPVGTPWRGAGCRRVAWVERRLAGSSVWGALVLVASRQRMALLFQPLGAQEGGSWVAEAAAHSGWDSIQSPSRYPAPQASAAAGGGHAPGTEGCRCGRPLTPRSVVCFHKPKMRPPPPATRSGHGSRIKTRKNSQRFPLLSINAHAVYGGRPDATLKKRRLLPPTQMMRRRPNGTYLGVKRAVSATPCVHG